jgi:hypothetical protein
LRMFTFLSRIYISDALSYRSCLQPLMHIYIYTLIYIIYYIFVTLLGLGSS